MPNWIGRWDGGRQYETADGRTVWVIERRVDGKVKAIPTRATSENEAMAELALFTRDPAGFLAVHQTKKEEAKAEPLLSDSSLEDWKAQAIKKKLSANYVKGTVQILKNWREALNGRDLRKLEPKDLHQVLAKLSAPKGSLIAIKTYCSWLVETFQMRMQENPTLALKVPKARRSVASKGYPAKVIESTYTKITSPKTKTNPFDAATAQAVRDVYRLAATHGIHFSEICRIASGVDTEIKEVTTGTEIVGVVRFVHKNGDFFFLSLTKDSLAAALRLRARKSAPAESCVRKYLARAAGDAEPLRLGEFRHSFITLAKDFGKVVKPTGAGVGMEDISAAVGHKSPTTSKRFYDNSTIPQMVLIPLSLKHPDDPK